MLPSEQLILFDGDDEFKSRLEAHAEDVRAREAYAEARKAAWYRGEPFPEDIRKYYAFVNDCPRPKQRERQNAEYREWYWQHPEWRKHATQKLRALKLGRKVGNRHAILQVYIAARSADPIPCYWCRAITHTEAEREVDHIVPLTKGGDHCASNLCIACSRCNQSKSDTDPSEFRLTIAQERKANMAAVRRAGRNQLSLPLDPTAGIPRKGPRKATQLTLLKVAGSNP